MGYNVIAIEREYASGGREIGERLAQRLGIPCYGQEILERAAARLGQPIERLREIEEGITGSLLYSIAMFANLTSGQSIDFLSFEQKLALAETDIIRELSQSPCVIIGRGATAVLKDRADVLKVFVYADKTARINRAVGVYGINAGSAESVLHRFDKRRANYFRATTNVEWKDAAMYHWFLNSGKLGIEQAVDMLYEAVK